MPLNLIYVIKVNVKIRRLEKANFGQILCVFRVHYMKEQNGAHLRGMKVLNGINFGDVLMDLLLME